MIFLGRYFLFVFISVGLLFSCAKKKETVEAKMYVVEEVASDIRLPKDLMHEMESDYLKRSKSSTPVYVFIPLVVEFLEHSEGALKNPKMSFELPKGGGQIDLQDVVTGHGSFYMSFPSWQFDKNLELVHLYYVSNSPKKPIENEVFGMGCGKWTDLKNSFGDLSKSDFLKLNTTELRYIHLLAGHYLFVFQQSAQLYLTQLTVTDSRYSSELCSEVLKHDK